MGRLLRSGRHLPSRDIEEYVVQLIPAIMPMKKGAIAPKTGATASKDAASSDEIFTIASTAAMTSMSTPEQEFMRIMPEEKILDISFLKRAERAFPAPAESLYLPPVCFLLKKSCSSP